MRLSALNLSVSSRALFAARPALPAAPVIDGLVALSSVAGAVANDNGSFPDLTGCAVALTINNMPLRHPINDPPLDATKLVMLVEDVSYDVIGGVITEQRITRAVRGTLPAKRPWPKDWLSLGSTVPARSYCSSVTSGGVTRAYYTELGGTKGTTAPTHSADGQTVSDGGVLWKLIPLTQDTGYIEQQSSGDVIAHVMTDMPIYKSTVIKSVSLGAGAYVSGIAASLASIGSGATVTNLSTMPYPSPIVTIITPPHQRSTGTLRVEVVVDHGWGIHIGGRRPVAGIRATAWNMARTASVVLADVVDTELSTQYTTSGPGGCAVEVFPLTFNTSSLPAGDCFIELEVCPWLGTSFNTRFGGEGADWRASQAYTFVGTIVRNGSNYYQLKTAGVSASSGGPTGTIVSTDVTDGTCTWAYIGSDNLIVNSRNIQARWHFYNDPSNLLKIGYCFIDPSGTATGTTGVFSTFAAADAAKGTLSNCYATPAAAETALQSYHNTASGGLTTHNDSGGGHAYMKAGTHNGFGTAMGTRTRGSVWFYLQADPSAAPGTVIFGNGPVKAGHPRMWFGDGVTMTATATSSANIFFDRATDNTAIVKQATGELVISGVTYTAFDTTFGLQWRNGWVWLLNSSILNAAVIGEPKQQQSGYALVAGNNLNGPNGGYVSTPNTIGNTIFLLTAIRDFAAPTVPVMFSVIRDNRIHGPVNSNGGVLIFLYTYNAGGNYGYPVLGMSLDGNLAKSAYYVGCKVAQIGADGSSVPIYNLVEAYNSFLGQRHNLAYNDSNGPYHTQLFRGFNLSTTDNIVWDSTGHGNNPPAGSRCQNYWPVYGVASALNVNLNGSESGNAPGISSYLGMWIDPSSTYFALGGTSTFSSQFVSDTTGVTNAANQAETVGDFRPVAGSVIVNRASRQARKFDILGVTRRTDGSGAVGAYERAS
ncbi:hypothetical protein SAMN03159338_0542 [Sphingomonas sp. NFR04]|uniref:hypothetical protein n=1 Tax=Sphingomonas sp. NFR04 TaxID=1566283 RepID=UPI0008EA5929|nr:hypothetical protein [Sphingomonas sp. NFR04]SFJ00498.1 hypothetical protein SAMN03159338_0542 [Sphingomonas sp. NFR04]